MSSNDRGQLRHFQSLYLSSNGADMWFIIEDERIPSHKLILTASIPYYKEILSENQNNDESHLTDVSVESFKEFLKFIYLVKPNLTTDNIEGVMEMARRWQAEEIFTECEEFLKRSLIEISTLFFGYRLASEYKAKSLKKLFQDEICARASNAFKSASFLTLPREILVKILECNSLACTEIEIFYACIAWATATCVRNGLDPSNVEHLRSQLGDSLYQIRFTSMTNEEAATCIGAHQQLFTAIELQEILCMVGHRKKFKSKKFNWTIRYYDLNSKRNLNCSRLRDSDDFKSTHAVQTVEVTKFTCNRNVVLHGIELEMCQNMEQSIHIRIDERNQHLQSNECYNERSMARFAGNQLAPLRERQNVILYSCVARIPLNRGILLRANYTYRILITFNNVNNNSNWLSRTTLKDKVRTDCDTVFWFSERGIVSSLVFRRFDDRIFLRKIIHSPTFWMLVIAMILILCFGTAVYILPNLRSNILEFWPIAWTYAKYSLCIGSTLLVLFTYRAKIWIAISSSPRFQIIRDPVWISTFILAFITFTIAMTFAVLGMFR